MNRKRILITGKNSYIGISFQKWISRWPDQYEVETISVRGDSWRKKDFSHYDVVLHLAGIAHVSARSVMEEMYYQVNRDLAIEVAKKAKNDGIHQFIFMSSIIVYGDNGLKVIAQNTIPNPGNFYGKSKLQAEEGIRPLEDEMFKIAIIRPPMIYGKGLSGNYPKLAKLAQNLPVFPAIDNRRSMIHIDNLCEFIRIIIDNEDQGLFFPQNIEYVNTAELVKTIAEIHGKKMRLTRIFNPLILFLRKYVGIFKKMFGDMMVESSMSIYKVPYQIQSFKESIMLTEGNKREEEIAIEKGSHVGISSFHD